MPGISRRSIAILAIGCLGLFFLVPRALPGTFQNPLIVPTGADPLGVAAADLNNDGKPDLVYINAAGNFQYSLHVLLGNGNGTFTHVQDILLPQGDCCIITIADVTGDGIPDIITQGHQQMSGMVAVMIGNGDGTFQAPVISTFAPPNAATYPGFAGAIGVGDVNGDGFADLVMADASTGDIFVLDGDGSGHFTLASTLNAYMPNSVYLADLNGDGHLDIVGTDLLGATFKVFLGNGDGTFQTPVTYTGQPSTSALILTDVDGDGHPDMLTQYYPNVVAYFKGNADGTFGPLTTIPSAASSSLLVGVGDFNGDAIPDLLFTPPTGLGAKISTSNLNYSAMKLSVSGKSGTPFAIQPLPAIADFNGDGHLDVAMCVEGGIAVLLGNGDGTFASAPNYDLGEEVGAAAVADFNGDGFPDIAVTLPATFPRLLLGNGTGSFTLGPDPNASYAASGADLTAVVGDFNGDGKKDLDIGNMLPNTNSTGEQSIALGNGDGTFQTPVAVTNSSPIVADVNGDGRSDTVMVVGGDIVANLGQADGSFVSVSTPLRLPNVFGVFNVGDVNKDGKPDVVINYGDHLEVWTGNGDGTFSYLDSVSLPSVISSDAVAAIADVDGDGNPDIVLAPRTGPYSQPGPSELAILYGNGDGTFQPPVYLPISRIYSQVVVADVNKDGKPDLVLTDGQGIAVILNLGARKFGQETDYVAGAAVSALSVTDVNGDGYPDIVAANTGGTTVAVLLNEPNANPPGGAAVSGNLTVSPASPADGQPFSVTLSVAGQTSGSATPTGSVSFYMDGGFQATEPLASGVATFTDSNFLPPAQHTVTATYNGDSNYAGATFSAIFTVVTPTYATTTTLVAAPTTLLASQTVRLTATVTSSMAVAGGAVTFLDGGQAIGSAQINPSGVAYFDTAMLGAGVHSLTAQFHGFTLYGFEPDGITSYVKAILSPSTSAAVSVTVNANATTTALSGPATATAGTVQTFNAGVSSTAGTPFGGVSFYDGSTLLGTIGLNANAVASFSTASLAAGAHSITATYNANATFAASSATPVAINVTAAAVGLAPTLVLVAPEMNSGDGAATLTAQVSAANGQPRGIVTFLDDGAILGTVETNAAGTAILSVSKLGSGMHNFTASFSGAAGFAPSVSPVLGDEWPASGPGFSLTAGVNEIGLSPSGTASVVMSVAAIGGFGQPVELSCANGLPSGYTCSFSPGTLENGNSVLAISPAKLSAAPVGGTQSPIGPRAVASVVGLLAFAYLAFWDMERPRKRWRKRFALIAICCALGAMAGCAAEFSSASKETVLTIQAKSGSGSGTIAHSTQILVKFR